MLKQLNLQREITMRVIEEKQLQLGTTPIGKIKIDVQSRDDIPQILLGLQHIYVTPALRDPIFKLLETLIPDNINNEKGRKGMDLWKIFVLATLKVNLNWDYDRLQEMANEHQTIRQMLGHGIFDDDKIYKLQTLKDNLDLITEQALLDINQIVVTGGHTLLKKKPDDDLKGRCDSFVLKTDVHFPTDIGLLYDAIRCLVRDASSLCQHYEISDLRQSNYQIKQVKKQWRKVQKLKHSTSKKEEKRAEQKEKIKTAHQTYCQLATKAIEKVDNAIEKLKKQPDFNSGELTKINEWKEHAERQISQIERRVIQGEKIPHSEKVFSIFEPHTEWISKGKAGVPVELGLRTCILETNDGFILNYQVMEKTTDDRVAVEMVKEAQKRFPQLRSCSFDKGFYSPQNQKDLAETLDLVILPKKGRWSKADKERESADEFVAGRCRHSAVESAINGLQNHGLDLCRDKGLEKLKKYVGLAIVARNIQKVGAILRDKERKRLKRLKKLAETRRHHRLKDAA